MSEETIQRGVPDKTKGYRLQKLRACNLALDEIEKDEFKFFYIAIELDEDVAKITTDEETVEYYEEDKDYPTSKFTLNSSQVKNTLVSFFDLFIDRWRESDNICFGFYTTAEIGKESNTKAGLKEGIDYTGHPNKILELLKDENVDTDTLEIIRKVLLVEYEKQYNKKPNKGNLNALETMSNENFKKFLGCIKWYFGREDNSNLKILGLVKVRNCQFFNHRLEGKEEYIYSHILECIEEKQSEKNYSNRFIDKNEIKLIFREAETIESGQKMDNVWEKWDDYELESNPRALEEKIASVCKSFNNKLLGTFARRSCSAKSEEQQYGKDYLSLKFRVLEACENIIHTEISNYEEINQTNILEIIEKLKEEAVNCIDELVKDYHYPINNAHSIKSIILNLFDSCYLAFD